VRQLSVGTYFTYSITCRVSLHNKNTIMSSAGLRTPSSALMTTRCCMTCWNTSDAQNARSCSVAWILCVCDECGQISALMKQK
jgi:hypothetical protein